MDKYEAKEKLLIRMGNHRRLKYKAQMSLGREIPVHVVPIGKKTQAGTSFTDGKIIEIFTFEYFWDKSIKLIVLVRDSALIHEAEHNRSSDFDDFKKSGETVAEKVKKLGIHPELGRKLGLALHNIVEDGRIERIAVNRYPGEIKGFKLLNAYLYMINTLDVNAERNPYSDFMAGCLTLAKTGLKPKNWDALYDATEQDKILNKIAYIIYNATLSNYTEDVVKAVDEISDIILPWIKDGLKEQSEFIKKLEEMAADAPQVSNSKEKQEQQAHENGSGGISINTPRNIPNNNSSSSSSSDKSSDATSDSDSDSSPKNSKGSSSNKGAGVENKAGAHDAEEAAENANEIDINSLEEEIEQDKNLDEELERAQEVQDAEKAQNSDKDLTTDDLKDLENNSGLNFGDAQIEHMQDLMMDLDYEVPAEIEEAGGKIYNQLHELFHDDYENVIYDCDNGDLDVEALIVSNALRKAGYEDNLIFTQDIIEKGADCAAYIVCDTSGSTNGNIFNKELYAAAMLENGFGRFLPLKIATYDSDYNFRLRTVRDFNNTSNEVNCSWNFKNTQRAGGGTPTAEAMAYTGYELQQRPEENKLLIVITDGAPDDGRKVKEQVEKLREKEIKVIAILVQDRKDNSLIKSFENMYSNKDFITSELEDLPEELIQLVKNWILESL